MSVQRRTKQATAPTASDPDAECFGPSTGKNGPRVRNFVFTLPNYSDAEYNWFINNHGNPTFLVVAKETCPTTGTPHLQGAMCLGRAVAFKTVKGWLPFKRAHIEPMRGTPSDSLRYCMKEDPHPLVLGDPPKDKGKQSCLTNAIEALQSGRTMRSLADEMETSKAIVCFSRGLTTFRNFRVPDRDGTTAPVVFWLAGPPGVGKTKCAWEYGLRRGGGCPSSVFFVPNCTGTTWWWDNYDPAVTTVVVDDFRPEGVRFEELLKLCDRYPHQVQIKGGYTPFASKVIIFTSPKKIDFTFPGWENTKQLHRRLEQGGGGEFDFGEDGELAKFQALIDALPATEKASDPPRPGSQPDHRSDSQRVEAGDENGGRERSIRELRRNATVLQLEQLRDLESTVRRGSSTSLSSGDESSSLNGSRDIGEGLSDDFESL